MIILGKSRGGGQKLGRYLDSAGKNERVRLIEIRGTIAEDVPGAILEMESFAVGTRCEKPLYHAMINPEPPHRLTPEQRMEAIDALEEKLGLTGHARVVVLHEKAGREHLHVAWSRIDLEHMRAVSDSHNYRKHEEIARNLERRFGHERVQGAHHERDGVERPERTPSRAEWQQAERTGISGKMVKEEVTAAFRASDGPEAFRMALEDEGYILARGDRRDYVVIDRMGGIHSLSRRIEGMKAPALREFMAPIDPASLPSIEAAQEIVEDRERRVRESSVSHSDALIEKAYARGPDFVSQTQAALKDIRHHQENPWHEQEARPQRPPIESDPTILEHERKSEMQDQSRGRADQPPTAPEMGDYSSPPKTREPNRYRDLEPTEAERERMERLINEQGAVDQNQKVAPEMGDKSREVNGDRDFGRTEADQKASRIEIDPAALRQEEVLDQYDRERRQAREEITQRGDSSASSRSTPTDNIEMTEARQARIERLLNAVEENDHSLSRDDWPPDRQHEAPGGGRTRSQ